MRQSLSSKNEADFRFRDVGKMPPFVQGTNDRCSSPRFLQQLSHALVVTIGKSWLALSRNALLSAANSSCRVLSLSGTFNREPLMGSISSETTERVQR